MASAMGIIIPLAAVGWLIYYLVTDVREEYKANKRLDKLVERNAEKVLGVRYWER